MNVERGTWNVELIRNEFPILKRTVHGNAPLIYLDNAASTQRPQAVINALTSYMEQHHSNVHRGGHALATEATQMYEGARALAQKLIHANAPEEIIFTKGTTEGVNLVANAWGNDNVKTGDEVIVSEMEHHAIIVPMQMLCKRVGATLKVIPVLDDGSIDMGSIERLITDKTKLLAITHVSNVLGTVNDIQEVCRIAKAKNVTTLIDGAQAVAHMHVDVHDIDCDFYVFSAHKLYGPTGVGVLYGKKEILGGMQPYQGGGSMISSVRFEETTYNDIPFRYEAGTPNIDGVVGFSAALEWFGGQDRQGAWHYEHDLLKRMTDGLNAIEGMRIIGNAPGKVSIVSFVVDGTHPNDIGVLCDEQGVALRVGHHCTMPLMNRFHVSSTARASLAMYSTVSDVDVFVNSVKKSVKMLR